MRTHSLPLAWMIRISIAFLAVCLTGPLGRAEETGTLKLKVAYCLTVGWVADADVDVVITRPGGGTIATGTGHTNGSGYVELTFSNLEEKDIAHVTVTPSGQAPDANHTYYWVVNDAQVGSWDPGTDLDSICADEWYDEANQIILCRY